MEKLRLGYVEGTVAVRVMAVMEVKGWSAAEFTREAVKTFLSVLEVQDRDRQKAVNVSDSVAAKAYRSENVAGLGLCLICPDGTAVTFEDFIDMVRDAMIEGLKGP